jgi:hypothetical protein
MHPLGPHPVAGVVLTFLAITVNGALPFSAQLPIRALASAVALFVSCAVWVGLLHGGRWTWRFVLGGLVGGVCGFTVTALLSIPGLTDLFWGYLKSFASLPAVVVFAAGWLVISCGGAVAVLLAASRTGAALRNLARGSR